MKKIVLTFTGTYSGISNSQEELIALVTSCSYWLFQRQHGYAAVYSLCLLLHSTSSQAGGRGCLLSRPAPCLARGGVKNDKLVRN